MLKKCAEMICSFPNVLIIPLAISFIFAYVIFVLDVASLILNWAVSDNTDYLKDLSMIFLKDFLVFIVSFFGLAPLFAVYCYLRKKY